MVAPVSPGLDARLRLDRAGFELAVEVDVPAGSTLALLGPNGAGKSTVVEVLAGLVALDEGHIRLGSTPLDDPARDVFVPAPQRRMGVVFQQYLLFEHLDVRDNVAFGPACRGRSRRAARNQVEQWLEGFELQALADRRPSALSGGQAQRVALARALAAEPDMVLLDEPLAAVDIEARAGLRRLLARHLGEFTGPRLLITHDPVDALLLADQVLVIEHGRPTQRGSPEEIRRHPATRYVAALAGTNLLTGTNDRGHVRIDEPAITLITADTTISGPVVVTIEPAAVALHATRPEGSPRNTWATTVAAIEPLGDINRIVLDQPVPLLADITPAATTALELAAGVPVWVSVKATEVDVRSR